jgi:peptide/nickel transport system substrate-binding protein
MLRKLALTAGIVGLAAFAALPSRGAIAAELTIGTVADPVSLDPQNHRDRNAQSILGNIYDGPFMRLPGGTIQPALIKEWARSTRPPTRRSSAPT